MCGRYYIDEAALWGYAQADIDALAAGVDICPGMDAPVLVLSKGEISAQWMRWGFERPEGGLVINARAETMSERPMFRALAAGQRCAIPAACYYEWRRADHQKYDVRLDGGRFWMAGLYRIGRDCREFVVLTQPPVPQIRAVHNRMPLILPTPDAVARWLRGDTALFESDGAVRVAAEDAEQLRMPF